MSDLTYKVTNLSGQNIFLEEGMVPVGTAKLFRNFDPTVERALALGLVQVDVLPKGGEGYILDDGKISEGAVNIDDDVFRLLRRFGLLDADGNPIAGTGTVTALTQTFTLQTSVVVTHNFGRKPIVAVVDDSGKVLIPESIIHGTDNEFTVTFNQAKSGIIIAI